MLREQKKANSTQTLNPFFFLLMADCVWLTEEHETPFCVFTVYF